MQYCHHKNSSKKVLKQFLGGHTKHYTCLSVHSSVSLISTIYFTSESCRNFKFAKDIDKIYGESKWYVSNLCPKVKVTKM